MPLILLLALRLCGSEDGKGRPGRGEEGGGAVSVCLSVRLSLFLSLSLSVRARGCMCLYALKLCGGSSICIFSCLLHLAG